LGAANPIYGAIGASNKQATPLHAGWQRHWKYGLEMPDYQMAPHESKKTHF